MNCHGVLKITWPWALWNASCHTWPKVSHFHTAGPLQAKLKGGVHSYEAMISLCISAGFMQPTIISGNLEIRPSVIQTPVSTPPFLAIRISEKFGLMAEPANSTCFLINAHPKCNEYH